ncbi:hypothetical protein [Mesorhizobium sp.]|uniref:hypothetical protein n=1 Tax=Mesorhizobium sp. TaxID=1871066 RepID=UPI0025F273C1|nr:hypothetical protein [Mesorhizobium sp.]
MMSTLMALSQIDRLLNQLSLMTSYDFKLVVTLVAFPLVLLLRKPQKVAAGAPAVHID